MCVSKILNCVSFSQRFFLRKVSGLDVGLLTCISWKHMVNEACVRPNYFIDHLPTMLSKEKPLLQLEARRRPRGVYKILSYIVHIAKSRRQHLALNVACASSSSSSFSSESSTR